MSSTNIAQHPLAPPYENKGQGRLGLRVSGWLAAASAIATAATTSTSVSTATATSATPAVKLGVAVLWTILSLPVSLGVLMVSWLARCRS